jgi:acetyl esterase/lipase
MTSLNRREFVRDTLGTGIALAFAPTSGRAAAPCQRTATVAIENPYTLVDPELVPALKQLPKFVVNSGTLPAMRKGSAAPPLPAPAPQPVERYIPGPPGAPEVRLVMVDPAPGGKGRPAFLHTHGGGYVFGAAGFEPTFLQRIAQSCNCVVVSVDYRIAPETRFPGSLEDNYAALRWLYVNADMLGIDRKRIAIGGESGGGGHAATLAIATRDRKEIPIVLQLLIYPMLDDRTGSSRPVPPHIGQFNWTAESNVFGWTSLLGIPAGSARVPAGAVPARVENLVGLPPAFIVVGSIDLFVDEDIEYARRLIDAGVPTELHVLPGAYHGFDMIAPKTAVTNRFTEYWTTALRRAFATS